MSTYDPEIRFQSTTFTSCNYDHTDVTFLERMTPKSCNIFALLSPNHIVYNFKMLGVKLWVRKLKPYTLSVEPNLCFPHHKKNRKLNEALKTLSLSKNEACFCTTW